MKRKSIFYTMALCSILGVLTACEDMFDVTSSSVQYEGSHEINSPADSLYSVIGILSKVQGIADRTVLLGELRGDLVDENVNTENDLREIINYNVSPSNSYCNYSDYYAVINNCNYFLSKVDTTVLVSNQAVLLREYAVVKAIRAWTYLQMTLVYKSVPFITEPILSVVDAEKDYPYYTFEDVCDYFIADLLPYVDTEYPNYGEINKINSKKMFFPIRLLLGDMYLWKKDYANAYRYYAEYMYNEELGTVNNSVSVSGFNVNSNDFSGLTMISSTDEDICIIPMSESKLSGTTTNLNNIFSSTDVNEGKRPISPSYAWKELAEMQDYAYEQNATTIRHIACGDARAIRDYGLLEWTDGSYNPNLPDEEEWYRINVESKYLVNYKYSNNYTLPVYTIGNVYLRMAEALNRMGDCEGAFTILKDGVASVHIVDGDISFMIPTAENDAYKGIHARGAGSAGRNDEYHLPTYEDFVPSSVEPTVTAYLVNDTLYDISAGVVGDTIVYLTVYHSEDEGVYGQYAVPEWRNPDRRKDKESPDTLIMKVYPKNYLVEKVEDLIVDEMALETAFEGNRFADLMRVARHRDDPAYLADKVARRKGENHPRNEELFVRLSTPDNWFINKE